MTKAFLKTLFLRPTEFRTKNEIVPFWKNDVWPRSQKLCFWDHLIFGKKNEQNFINFFYKRNCLIHFIKKSDKTAICQKKEAFDSKKH